MSARIDAHHHLWQPARGDYDWMPKDNAILNRAYAPADLAPMLAHRNINATILVQAAATIEETEYMLGLADATDWIVGVVGWVNFEDPGHLSHLTRLAAPPKFVGVRPMIQDIEDANWMLRDDVQWAYQALIDLDLTFDALGFPRHLDNFNTLLRRYPDLRTVIDHCMKPQIRDHSPETFQHWADGMNRLADTGAYCKLSGLVTEAAPGWTIDDLRPYAQHILKTYGPDRTLWGSDWPVCHLAASYADWCDTAQALTAHLAPKDQSKIFGQTAQTVYRLTN